MHEVKYVVICFGFKQKKKEARQKLLILSSQNMKCHDFAVTVSAEVKYYLCCETKRFLFKASSCKNSTEKQNIYQWGWIVLQVYSTIAL